MGLDCASGERINFNVRKNVGLDKSLIKMTIVVDKDDDLKYFQTRPSCRYELNDSGFVLTATGRNRISSKVLADKTWVAHRGSRLSQWRTNKL